MKSAYLLTAALLLGTLSSAVAEEEAAKKKKPGKHNPSGTWVWESDVDGTYIQSQLKLSLRGKKLTGEYSDDNVSLDLENAEFDGKTVTFTLEFDVDGTEVRADFSGVVEGDKITGTTLVDLNGNEFEMPVDGKRRTLRRDVVGEWKLKSEIDGQEMESTVTIKLEKGKLAGSYSSEVAGDHALQDVSLKSNKLSFTVAGETVDGTAFTGTFTGTPRGDRIRGNTEIEVDGAQMTAKVRGRRVIKKKEKSE